MNRPRRSVLLASALIAAVAPVVGLSSARAAATCAVAEHAGGDWRMYGQDYANTRSQPQETVIGPEQADTLAPAWTFNSTSQGGAGSFTSTPVIADGCMFIATTSGWVFALNADTGELVWQTKLARGVNNSVTVVNRKVYALTGLRAAALDQATGALLWESDFLDEQNGSEMYGSPLVWNGVLMAGISGGGAELGDEEDRAAFHGALVFVDAETGEQLPKTWVIPEADWAAGNAGAGVWGTPALDTETGYAYVGTGNPFQPQIEHKYANAIIKFDMDRTRPTFGQIVASYKGTLDEFVPGFSELPCVDVPGNPPPWYPQGRPRAPMRTWTSAPRPTCSPTATRR